MATNLEKFRGLLRELFQLDQADLDFGIYRIINHKRHEVVRFLDQDLLPQVRRAFAKYKSSDKTVLETELAKLAATLADAGMNPDDSPKVKALKQQIAESSVDVAGLENEVYSHLFNFFRRYYLEGDFISLRRYKEGVYAIPYEGEEVKLHWANADQYYVKSSEYLRDYAFALGGGKRVHFRLIEADTEKDNNKAPTGNERRFVLADGADAVTEVGSELIIRFTYKQDEQKRKQAALNDAAEKRIIASAPGNWPSALSAVRLASTVDPKPSVLRHHLAQYTARNTFDYFIHKNLGGFLRREFDFYIKNEVMHLDDVLPTEQDTAEHQQAVLTAAQAKMASRLSVIAILRDIGHKIIRFLAQIEEFQKKLWLKKKFVVATDWLLTIDRVPPNLRDVVAKNERQWAAWDDLGFKPVELPPGSPEWATREYLDANDKLVVDTALFNDNPTFLMKLLASNGVLGGKLTLDDATTGVLLHSDNFQALNLMEKRYAGQIKCAYIDPPYNTGDDGFAYKDGYFHSSWMAMIADRVTAAQPLMHEASLFNCSIDRDENRNLLPLLFNLFGESNFVEEVVWQKAYGGGSKTKLINNLHEYVHCFARHKDSLPKLWHRPDPEVAKYYKYSDSKVSTRGKFRTQPLYANSNDYRDQLTYPIPAPKNFNPKSSEAASKLSEVRELLKQNRLVLSGSEGTWQLSLDAEPWDGEWIYPPKQWQWSWEKTRDAYIADELVFTRSEDGYSLDYKQYELNEDGTPRGRKPASIEIGPYTQSGTTELEELFKTPRAKFPKPSGLIEIVVDRFYPIKDFMVLDYFAGSGTTAHAVMQLNRGDEGSRKFVLVEMGEQFDTVLKPRVAKVTYSPDWKEGHAASHGKGISALVKVLRLEGYEDTLNNLRLARTAEQAGLLSQDKELAEQYMLGYLLDTESRGSASLLNVEGFSNPFAYTMNITTGSAGETKPATVDLVETFNWLLGLRVKHIDHVRGIRVVDGTNPKGERVLVLWRNVDEVDSDKLDKWFEKQGYSTQDMEYAVVYVNGDNNLENLRRADQTWKVRLIEEEFQRLMFDVQDV